VTVDLHDTKAKLTRDIAQLREFGTTESDKAAADIDNALATLRSALNCTEGGDETMHREFTKE
jgi:hypothetical protein